MKGLTFNFEFHFRFSISVRYFLLYRFLVVHFQRISHTVLVAQRQQKYITLALKYYVTFLGVTSSQWYENYFLRRFVPTSRSVRVITKETTFHRVTFEHSSLLFNIRIRLVHFAPFPRHWHVSRLKCSAIILVKCINCVERTCRAHCTIKRRNA